VKRQLFAQTWHLTGLTQTFCELLRVIEAIAMLTAYTMLVVFVTGIWALMALVAYGICRTIKERWDSKQ